MPHYTHSVIFQVEEWTFLIFRTIHAEKRKDTEIK